MLQAVAYVSETGKDFSRNRDEPSRARISGPRSEWQLWA
jgi:hypothetical protein